MVDILEYESVVAQLKEYCDSLNIPPFEEEKPEGKPKAKPKANAKGSKKPADKPKSGKAAVRRIKK